MYANKTVLTLCKDMEIWMHVCTIVQGCIFEKNRSTRNLHDVSNLPSLAIYSLAMINCNLALLWGLLKKWITVNMMKSK